MKFESNVVVTNSGQKYKTEIKAGNHTVLTDEPIDHDGQDLGPTAHQLLLGSLGACMAITVKMYADRKQWKVDNISVELNMEKVIEDGAEKTRIFSKVDIKGDLTAEQLARLQVISTKCPVHKTLTNPVTIVPFTNG
jgi:putative redox protein